MLEKYGFVYIWRDRKHKRYYIGSHWGTEDDGYICSSRWMRNSYRRRPEDFKRKTISKNLKSVRETFVEEQKWISLIKEFELGVRYYNRTRNVIHGDGVDRKGISEQTREKMRQAKLGTSNIHKGKSLEELHGIEKAQLIRSKLQESHLGQEAWNKDKKFSEERLIEHGKIRRKSSVWSMEISEIKKLYCDDELSVIEIAKTINCSPASIRKFMIVNDIPRRDDKSRYTEKYKNKIKGQGKGRVLSLDQHLKILKIDMILLEKMLALILEDKLSYQKIADQCGVIKNKVAKMSRNRERFVSYFPANHFNDK